MRKNNKILYERIMRNISRQIKHILNEQYEQFDVTEYNDNEENIIDNQEIFNLTDRQFFKLAEIQQKIKKLDIIQPMKYQLLPSIDIIENNFNTLSSDFYYKFNENMIKDIDIKRLKNIFNKNLRFYRIVLCFNMYYDESELSQEDLNTAIQIVKNFIRKTPIKKLYNAKKQFYEGYLQISRTQLEGEYQISINGLETKRTLQESFNDLMNCLDNYINYLTTLKL